MEYNFLKVLNRCICYLLVEWEVKLHSLEPQSNAPHCGRPKKQELVSGCNVKLRPPIVVL